MVKGTSMFGLLAMVETFLILVLQMAIFQASTLLELVLLMSLATRLTMTKNVHQRWS